MSNTTKFITKSSSYRDILHAMWLMANKPVTWNINETDFSREQFSKWDQDFKTRFEKDMCEQLGVKLTVDELSTGNYILEVPHRCACHETVTEHIHDVLNDQE